MVHFNSLSAYQLVYLPSKDREVRKHLLEFLEYLYPNFVALIALNNFKVTFRNFRGSKIGIKAVIDMSSQWYLKRSFKSLPTIIYFK